MPTNEPIAPQDFDFVEIYVSNLPVDRVKEIRMRAEIVLKNNPGNLEETLCGYILQLTELNKNQK